MKRIFEIYAVVLILGLSVLSFAKGAWADTGAAPSATPEAVLESSPETTVEATPARHHRSKKSKAVNGPAASATPEDSSLSSTPTVIPTLAAVEPSLSSLATPSSFELSDVVITGTKTKGTILDSPAAVSVVPRSDIDNKDIVYFDDALTGLPGVEVADEGAGTSNILVTMRGMINYDKNLILLDGFNLAQSQNERVFWNRVPSALVDDVEVVRGPFSALYGRSALGGVVNIITREPEGESLNLSSDFNSSGILTTDVSYQNRLSKEFAFYLGLENTTTDGYTYYDYVQASPYTGGVAASATVTGFTKTTTNSGSTIYNVGELDQLQLASNNDTAKFYFTPAEDQTISLLLNYAVYDQNTTTGLLGQSFLTDVNTGQQVASGVVSLQGTGQAVSIAQSQFFTQPGTNGFFGSYLQYKGQANPDLGLSANFSYTDGPFQTGESKFASASTATALTGGATGQSIVDDWEYFGNAQADLKLGNHDLIFGGEYDIYNSENLIDTWANWRDFSSYTTGALPSSDSHKVDFSGFAQDEWKIFKPLIAYVGIRYDNWSTNGEVINSTDTAETVYPSHGEDAFSPKVSLVYKIDENGSLRASWGTAFNPPTTLELFSNSISSTSQTLPNPNLVPEDDTAWEFGGEYEFPTLTTVSATYFDNNVTNLIYTNSNTALDGFTTSQSLNAGQADIRGIESEVKQKVFSFLSVFGNYTHVDAIITSNSAVPSSVGEQIPNVPADVANAGADILWNNFDLNLFATYQSKRYQNNNDSDTVNGVQGSFDPYTIANAKLTYRFKNGRVFVGVNNIFNLQYYSLYLNPGTTVDFGTSLVVF